MQLTERDLNIMKAINRFGCVDVSFVADLFEVQPKIAYRRLQLMVLGRYLAKERILYKLPSVYRVTQQGADISSDDLPPLKRISMVTYRHNLLVAKLSTKLLRQYGGEFISERDLRHESEFSGVGAPRHLCDGVLKLPDKNIAIEVELSTKGARRLQKIIKQYRQNLEYQEVWYFCGTQEVRKKLEKAASTASFIKLFDLKEYLEL